MVSSRWAPVPSFLVPLPRFPHWWRAGTEETWSLWPGSSHPPAPALGRVTAGGKARPKAPPSPSLHGQNTLGLRLDHTLYCPSQHRAGVQAALPGKPGRSGLAGPAPPPAQQCLGKSRQPVQERAVEAAVEVDILLLGAGGGASVRTGRLHGLHGEQGPRQPGADPSRPHVPRLSPEAAPQHWGHEAAGV